MKKLYITPILFTVISLFVISCSSSDDDTIDTVKPTIVINDPVNGKIITPGTDIHFDADFTDNVELASYKIDIHNTDDGHSHARTPSAEVPWAYNQAYTINSGLKNIHVHNHISVPTEINGSPIQQGNYHFGVYLIDKSGNQQQVFIDIVIGEGGEDHDHENAH